MKVDFWRVVSVTTMMEGFSEVSLRHADYNHCEATLTVPVKVTEKLWEISSRRGRDRNDLTFTIRQLRGLDPID